MPGEPEDEENSTDTHETEHLVRVLHGTVLPETGKQGDRYKQKMK